MARATSGTVQKSMKRGSELVSLEATLKTSREEAEVTYAVVSVPETRSGYTVCDGTRRRIDECGLLLIT